MRTTLTIADEVLDRLKREAKRSRRSLKAVVNEALRLGVDQIGPRTTRKPFKQQTFKMGERPDAQLDKALQLAALLDDAEVARKLAHGK